MVKNMDFKVSDNSLREWYCPIYDRKIDEALCYEISNIGELPLPETDRLPGGIEEAQLQCECCRHYTDWE